MNLWQMSISGISFTFFPHPHLEALLESAVLTLVPVILVDRTVSAAATSVSQVPSN